MNDTSAPPVVGGYPIVGVLPEVWKDPLAFFVNAARTHGRIAQFDLGPRRFYLVSHPDDIKYVLQDNNRNYGKDDYAVLKAFLGEGLVTSEGDLWRRQRRLMQPSFHRNEIAKLATMMTQAGEEMLARWAAQPRGKPLDAASEMMLLTQTIIVRTMFSTDVSQEAARLGRAFENVLQYLNQTMFSPIRIPLDWPTPTNVRFRRSNAYVTETVYRIINERRQSGQHSADLLGMLLSARDEDGEGMSDQQIRDEVMTIFFAGHETTASTLSWAWHLLGQHADARERLEAELAQALGGRTPTFDDLPQLSYTRMVIDETLRLFPPGWMFVRSAQAADEVGGYHIPAQASMMISPYVTHRLPEYWPQPDRFDPERFNPEQPAERHRFAYLPFAMGPRKCIGDQFALVEATLLLAMIAQRFRLNPAPGRLVRALPVATLRPRPGVLVTLQPR